MQYTDSKKITIHFSVVKKVRRAIEVLQLWMDRAHQRKQLARLEDHELKDIGLNRADVYKEINKPFWK